MPTPSSPMSFPSSGAGRVQQNVEGGGGITPIGGSKSVRLMQGLEGFVDEVSAATHEMREVAKQLRVINERTDRFYGSSASVGAGAGVGGVTGGVGAAGGLGIPSPLMGQILGATMSQAYSAMGVNMASPLLDTPPAPGVPSPGVHTAHRAAREHHAASTATHPARHPASGWGASPAPEEERHTEPPARRGFDDDYGARVGRFDAARRFSVRDLRQSVFGGFQRAVQHAGGHWGQQLQAATEELPQGVFGPPRTQWTVPMEGGRAASEGEIGGYLKRQNVIGGLKNVGGALAEGESPLSAIGGLLPEGAAGIALPVVAGVGLAVQAGHWAESQRAENARFQSIMGGSNFAAFGERARSRGFALSQFGTMGSKQAEELYMGVSETGLRGGERQRALDFATREYKNLGMSISDSVKLIQIASSTGQTSLTGVADALKGVSNAAKEAGVNTDLARQRFIQNYQAWSGTFGAGAATLAGASATAMAGQGRILQNVDTSQEYGQDRLAMLAARTGMSYNQVVAMGMGTQRQQAQLAQISTQQQRQISGQVLGNAGQQAIASFMQERGIPAGKKLTTEQHQELMGRLAATPGMTDLRAMMPILSKMTGVDVTSPEQALDLVVRLQTGELNEGQAASSMVTGSQIHTVSANQRRSSETAKKVAGNIGLSREQLMLTGGSPSGTSGGTHDRLLYLRHVQKTGRESPIIQDLLKNNYDASRRFKVQTKGGKEKVVTTGEAIQDYADQLESGKAEIVAGTGAGGTLAAALHKSPVDMATPSAQRAAKSGTDYEKWEAKHGGTQGKVTIAPTPELARYLKITATGGASVDPSSGLVPPPARSMPDAAPTG